MIISITQIIQYLSINYKIEKYIDYVVWYNMLTLLPSELLIYIFSFLTTKSIANIASTNKLFLVFKI